MWFTWTRATSEDRRNADQKANEVNSTKSACRQTCTFVLHISSQAAFRNKIHYAQSVARSIGGFAREFQENWLKVSQINEAALEVEIRRSAAVQFWMKNLREARRYLWQRFFVSKIFASLSRPSDRRLIALEKSKTRNPAGDLQHLWAVVWLGKLWHSAPYH